MPAIGYIIIGIFTALLGSVVGIGGGLILVPVFSAIIGLPPAEAAATSLASVAVFSSVTTMRNRKNRLVHLKFAIFTAIGALLGVVSGVKLSLSLPLLLWKFLFVFIALFIAFNLLWASRRGINIFKIYLNSILELPLVKKTSRGSIHPLIFIMTGIMIGLMSALLGIGGGFFLTPFFLMGLELPPKQAVATALMVIAITSTTGSISHYFEGHIHLRIWLLTTLGMAAGGWVGSHLLLKIEDSIIKWLFSLVIMIGIILVLIK